MTSAADSQPPTAIQSAMRLNERGALDRLTAEQRLAWWQFGSRYHSDAFGQPIAPYGRILLIGPGNASLSEVLRAAGADVTCFHAEPRPEKDRADTLHDLELLTRATEHEPFDVAFFVGSWTQLPEPERTLQSALHLAPTILFESAIEDRWSEQALSGLVPTAAQTLKMFDQYGCIAFPLFPDDAAARALEELRYAWPIRDSGDVSRSQRRAWLVRRRASLPAPNSRRISIVVQGPVVGMPADKWRRRLTAQCLLHLRRLLPDSELILSTWRDMPCEQLEFDRLVQSDDPGGMLCDDEHRVFNNINRQVVSSHAGLAAATRPFALKIRSDLLLGSVRFLEYWQAFPRRDPRYQFAADRILNCSVYARRFAGSPPRHRPVVFHPSDFLFFGWTTDVRQLFDIPLCPLERDARWLDGQPPSRRSRDPFPTNLNRFLPEQWLWLGYLRHWLDTSLQDRLDLKHPAVSHDRAIQLNNLVMLDQSQWSFQMPKYRLRQYLMSDYDWQGLYRHDIWRRDYQAKFGIADEPAATYDSQARWWLIDHPVARLARRRMPYLASRLDRRLRKFSWLR